MKILIYDKMQDANGVPTLIKTPALGDAYSAASSFPVNFDSGEKINCVGIGYTDATELTLTSSDFDTRTIDITKSIPDQNGLYLIDEIDPDDEYEMDFEVSHNGTYIGRVGLGEYRKLGTSPSKEIGFYSTNENRITKGGQVIPGGGGITGRRFEADVRYKINEEIWNDIRSAMPKQIGKGFPYFLYTDDERHKLPADMLYFYAYTNKPLSLLQSSSRRFLYSYKFSFLEGF